MSADPRRTTPVAVAAYIAAVVIGILSLWFIAGVLSGIAGSVG